MPRKAVKKGQKSLTTITTFELPTDQLDRLRRLAALEDLSVSYIVRRGLEFYVESRLKARDVSPEVKAILNGKA